MPLTMQEIVQTLLPRTLDIDPSDIDATDATLVTYAQAMEYVQQAYEDISNEAVDIDSYALETESDFTVSSTTDIEVEQAFPANLLTLRSLLALSGSGGYPVGVVYAHDATQPPGNLPRLSDEFKMRAESVILLNPSYSNYRFTYMRQPGPLCWGAVSSGGSTSLVAGTVTAGSLSPVDSAYVGDRIAAINASGDIQVRKVTAYVASTKTFTVSAAWDTNPDSTYTFSMISWLPEAHQRLLVHGAATRFDKILSERAQSCMPAYQKGMAMLMNQIKRKDSVTPDKVTQNEPSKFYKQG